MNPYSELFLRCSTLANAADIKGPLGQDILCKCIINARLGFVMSTRTDEGHFVKLHGPITLRTLRFKLTDVDGNTVNTRLQSLLESLRQSLLQSSLLRPKPAEPAPAPKRRGRLPGSKNKPKAPKTVPAEEAVPAPTPEPAQPPSAPSPVPEPARPEALAEPVRMTPAQERALRYMQRQDGIWSCSPETHTNCKGTMMPFERRNEPLMLRQFSRMYSSHNLNPLLRRRHQQLVEGPGLFALRTHRHETASET